MIARDTDATWRTTGSLCCERDWSKRRLLHELENGLPYQTIPPGYTVEWGDDSMWPYFSVERSEISIPYGLVMGAIGPPPSKRAGYLRGPGLVLGIEVLAPRVPAASPALNASAQWVFNTARALRAAGKVPDGMKKSELARLLEKEVPKAVKDCQLSKPIGAPYMENWLEEWGAFPPSLLD